MPSRSSRRSAGRYATLAVFAAALGLLLCSIGPGAAGTHGTHTVVMEAVSFQPSVLTARVGDSIVWVNKDPFPHTATSGGFDSKDIPAGASWTYTAKARGEQAYGCTLHPTMKATLRVR